MEVGNSNMRMHLLNYLAQKCRCEYLSDLHFLNDSARLSYILKNIRVGDWDLEEWNETANYITESDGFRTSEEARDYILGKCRGR